MNPVLEKRMPKTSYTSFLTRIVPQISWVENDDKEAMGLQFVEARDAGAVEQTLQLSAY